MTNDRSLERAARSWLEEGPTRAPDRPVDAALARIQTTPQERDHMIPWRHRTMIDRLAAAAVMAVIATATGVLGASLLLTPTPNAAAPCAAVFNEADATDTSLPGLSQPQRSWGIPGGAPREVGPGGIATFAAEPPDNVPGTLIVLDVQTRSVCRLV